MPDIPRQIRDILTGTQDKWFRPSDVKVAPDGSLVIADWYDPGVGGHGMGDLDRGRLFRIVPDDHDGTYKVPKFDFDSAAGAIEALKNPNYAVRYMAWQSLHKMGNRAEAELQKLASSDNPIYRARALWLLGKIDGSGAEYGQASDRRQRREYPYRRHSFGSTTEDGCRRLCSFCGARSVATGAS